MSSLRMPLAATRGARSCVRRPVAMAISGTRLTAVAALGAAVLCLGACTDEPSESAMRQAASNYLVDKIREQGNKNKDGGRTAHVLPHITTFSKISCTSNGAQSSHYCAFEGAINGEKFERQNGIFFKDSNGKLIYSENR